jgi:hypothetical protein
LLGFYHDGKLFMNWASGICVENGMLVVAMADRIGNHRIGALPELATAGIPSCLEVLTRPPIRTNFKDWQIIPATKYLAAHTFRRPNEINSKHQVFQFQVRDTKFQVPALVLMRAIFYPSILLLSIAFGPQCLDNLGYLDGDVLILANRIFPQKGYRWLNEPLRSRLRWLYAFPSAHRMAHSIHEYALNGVVGLSLPDATITWILAGKKIRDTYYVTAMTPSKILTFESTFDYVPFIPPTVLGYETNRNRHANEIIPHDGQFLSTSDEEWDAIAPILLEHSPYRTRLSQRNLFDCILEKLHSGVPWRQISSKSGTYVNASDAYRAWKAFGTFEPALKKLRKIRSSAIKT